MPECPICGDVSWTFLEDAQRDTAGVLSCISRREQAALVHDGDGEALLAYELLERARAGSGTS